MPELIPRMAEKLQHPNKYIQRAFDMIATLDPLDNAAQSALSDMVMCLGETGDAYAAEVFQHINHPTSEHLEAVVGALYQQYPLAPNGFIEQLEQPELRAVGFGYLAKQTGDPDSHFWQQALEEIGQAGSPTLSDISRFAITDLACLLASVGNITEAERVMDALVFDEGAVRESGLPWLRAQEEAIQQSRDKVVLAISRWEAQQGGHTEPTQQPISSEYEATDWDAIVVEAREAAPRRRSIGPHIELARAAVATGDDPLWIEAYEKAGAIGISGRDVAKIFESISGQLPLIETSSSTWKPEAVAGFITDTQDSIRARAAVILSNNQLDRLEAQLQVAEIQGPDADFWDTALQSDIDLGPHLSVAGEVTVAYVRCLKRHLPQK